MLKPSVLIVNPHFQLYGGAERQVVELANHLTDRNYKVTIFTTTAVPEFKQSLKEARMFECGTEQNLMTYCNVFAHKFDVINPHNHPSELYFSYPNKPNLIWQMNEPPGYVLEGNDLNPAERNYVSRTVKKIMVISDYDFARCRKVYGIDPVVNYPGVRYDFFNKNVKIKNTLNMKNNFVITQLGFFTWTKNQVFTVEIFAKIKKKIPEAKLVLMGYDAGDYIKKVNAKVEELGLEDDVLVRGYVGGDEDFRNIYNQTDVFVNPVLDQGGYATTFEAISAGIPTIVSDRFVASKLICDNELGWVSPLSKSHIIEAIMQIYNDLDKYKSLTKEKAIWIKDNLTWKNFGEKYEQVIAEVVN